MDHWDLIARERHAFADLVDALTPEQLDVPSLCGAWSVKEVAAHLAGASDPGMAEFLVAFVRGRFSFDRANETLTATRAVRPVEELTAVIREHAESRFSPPMMDWHAPLADVLIHREDMAVPLGLPADRPVEGWCHVLDFLVSSAARRGFVRGGRPEAHLVATDADWTHGEGPEVHGPAHALALTLSGRPAVVDRLSGPGADALAAWSRG